MASCNTTNTCKSSTFQTEHLKWKNYLYWKTGRLCCELRIFFRLLSFSFCLKFKYNATRNGNFERFFLNRWRRSTDKQFCMSSLEIVNSTLIECFGSYWWGIFSELPENKNSILISLVINQHQVIKFKRVELPECFGSSVACCREVVFLRSTSSYFWTNFQKSTTSSKT